MNDFLSQISLFSGVESDLLSSLYESSETQAFRKDTDIFQRGQLAEYLYVLQKGQIKLYNTRKGTGKEEIVCLIQPKQWFCLAPVLSRDRFHINAAPIEESVVLAIPRDRLHWLIETSHDFAKNLVRALAEKECQMCEEVCHLSLSTTKERLAHFLLNQYRRQNKQAALTLKLTQAQLASHLGTVRETLSRDINALKKVGIIDFIDGEYHILDELELSQLAGFDGLNMLSDK